MEVCGIICEYNPFHKGHAYLIGEVRRLLGADTAVLCAMSGDFVQRGEAAAFAKHARAAAAVAGGADLVLELPLPWCMAGAETFARGGVGLLAATGLVSHLAFGSESGDLTQLVRTAALLQHPALEETLRTGLAGGMSYAAARQTAAEELAGGPLPLLRQPNDILALEYLMALPEAITPLAVQRIGAGHDCAAADACPSAGFLRTQLDANGDISPWLPEPSRAVLLAAPRPDARLLETALLSRLRFAGASDFAAAPDAGEGEGFYHRVYEAARTLSSLEEIQDAASTRRYPRARVRRLCLSAALGIRAEDADGTPPYLRVLAANDRGRRLLRQMEATAQVPVLTKPAEVRCLSARARRVFTLGAQAADLLALGYATPAQRRGDGDWRSSPCIVK